MRNVLALIIILAFIFIWIGSGFVVIAKFARWDDIKEPVLLIGNIISPLTALVYRYYFPGQSVGHQK